MRKLSLLTLFFIPLLCQAQAEAPQLQAPLLVDGIEVGMGIVSPQAEADKLQVETKPLLDILESYLDKNYFERAKMKFSNKRFVTAGELKELGITTHFDDGTLNFEISIPTEIRKKNSIDFKDRHFRVERNVYLPSKYSGWLNVNLTDNYQLQGREDSFSSNFQLVQNFKGYVFDGTTTYQSQGETPWNLGNVHLSCDSRSKLVRYTLGDLNYPVKGFQVASSGGGFSATKQYAISPKTISHTLDKTSLMLKRPSQVEIFLNGNQLDNLKLPPGPVDLSNYPFTSGQNDIFIKVTDDQGNIETFNFSNLFHSQILREGFSEFNYSLELPNQTKGMKRDYNEDDVKFTSFYNYGLNKHFTSGLNAQADKKTRVLGTENLWLSPVGFLSLQFAGSSIKKHAGAAERLDYQSLERWEGKEAPFNFRSSLELRSASFTQVGSLGSDQRRAFDFYLSRRLPWSANIGSGLAFKDNRVREDQTSLRADYTQNIGRSWQWGTNYQHDFRGEKEKKVFLSLNWAPPSSTVQGLNTYESDTSNFTTQWRYQNTEGPHRFSPSALASRSDKNEKINVGADYSGPLFEARVSHTKNNYRPTSKTSDSGLVNLRFAGAWTNNNFAFTRPLRDAFVLVDTKPRPTNYQIPIGAFNNYGNSSIHKNGPAIVTNVQPYTETNLYLDVREIPVGKNVDQDVFTVIPPYMGGVDVQIELQTHASFLANIVDNDEKILALKTGQLYDEKNVEVASFFSNKEGQIFVDDLPTGTYTLVLNGDLVHYAPLKITVPPPEDGKILELGKLIIKKEN